MSHPDRNNQMENNHLYQDIQYQDSGYYDPAQGMGSTYQGHAYPSQSTSPFHSDLGAYAASSSSSRSTLEDFRGINPTIDEQSFDYDPYLKSPLGCYGAASGEAAGLDSDDCSPSSHGSHHDDAHGMDERLFPEDDSNYQPPNPALNKRGEPRQRAEKKYRKDFPDEETFLQYKKEQDKKRQQRKREKDKIKRQTSNSLFPPS